MAEAATLERLKQRRLDRMRQGQGTAEITQIPSDPELRVALVPLLEGEYEECMRASANVDVPENIAGAQMMDRRERVEVVCRSARETNDYTKHVFPNAEEMLGVIGPSDVNHLYDVYLEMIREISPRVETLSEEEIDFLKELFGNLPWKDLSGKQVYALVRFLSLLEPMQLTDKLPGRLLTPS